MLTVVFPVYLKHIRVALNIQHEMYIFCNFELSLSVWHSQHSAFAVQIISLFDTFIMSKILLTLTFATAGACAFLLLSIILLKYLIKQSF